MSDWKIRRKFHLSIFHNNKIKIKQIYKLYPQIPGIKFGRNRMLVLVHQQNNRGWISPHPVQRCITASSCLKLPPADLVHCAGVITNTLQSLLLMGQHKRESPTPSILGGVESSWVCQCVHGLSTIMHCPKSGSGVGQLIWDKVTSLLSTAVSNPGYMLTCLRNLQKMWCAGPPHMGVWVSTVWDIKPWHFWS